MGIWVISTFELFWGMLLWMVNTGFYVTCVFISLEHVPGSGVGRSFGNTMLSILKTCRVVFRNSCPSSPSRQQRWGSSFSSSSRMLVVICLSYSSRPGVCVKWCFAVVLFCFCLKADDVEYLVYCFVIGRLYMFFGEMSVLVLCSFFSCVVCLLFCCKLCTFWMQILHQTCDWQIIFSCRLSFHVLTGSLWGPSYLFWWNPI